MTKKNGLYGLINLFGIAVAPPIYEHMIPLYSTYEDKFKVINHGKFGLLEGKDGKLLLPCEYDNLEFYNEDGSISFGNEWGIKYTAYITAYKNGKYGLIDSLGKVYLPFIYDRIHYNNNQTYTVTKDGKQGIVDKNILYFGK